MSAALDGAAGERRRRRTIIRVRAEVLHPGAVFVAVLQAVADHSRVLHTITPPAPPPAVARRVPRRHKTDYPGVGPDLRSGIPFLLSVAI